MAISPKIKERSENVFLIMNKKIAPKVSIFIITYNQKNFLKEAIESVLAQSYPNVEIVVGDDGSIDGTKELLEEYSNRHQGLFKISLSQKNQGITHNCRRIDSMCTGKYIAYLGGDDLMLPGKIQMQVDFMEKHPECTLCYHNLDVFDSATGKTTRLYNTSKNIHDGDVRHAILYGTFMGACSVMLRADKKPKDGYDPRIPIASDWLYWIETLANGGEIRYIDAVLGRYRRHENNVTRIKRDASERLMTLMIVAAKYPHLASTCCKGLSRLFYGEGRKLRLRGEYSNASHYFRTALRCAPLNWKAWIYFLINLCSRPENKELSTA